jgi:D-Ala-D-Ala carboxypeptidase 3 (S13) family
LRHFIPNIERQRVRGSDGLSIRHQGRGQPQQGRRVRQRCDPRSLRQAGPVSFESVAGERPAGRQRKRFRLVERKITIAGPPAIDEFVAARIDLVHPRIEHREHPRTARLLARLLGHGKQRIDGEYLQASAEREPLGDGACGAQAGEGARPPSKHDGIKRRQLQAGLREQALDRRDEGCGCRRPAGAAVPPLARTVSHGDGQGLGAGVEGKQFQFTGPVQSAIIEGPIIARMLPTLRAILALVLITAHACGTSAATPDLPAEVGAALARARLPPDALSVLVVDVAGNAPPRVSHRAGVPVNPASVAKLVTTYAALELLGPAFTWSTPVYVDGTVEAGTLTGNLYLQGQGDPKLVVERLWLLLRRVQGLGIRQITGDIVLDRTAFESAVQDPAAFDGEPLRPYNAAPDALLLNFKSVVMTFVPDNSGRVQIQYEPSLSGVQAPASLPVAGGDCGDWRGALKADFSNPGRIQFAGAYPSACGERVWPVAYADPKSYSARAVAGAWADVGGRLGGQVREGKVPAGARAE